MMDPKDGMRKKKRANFSFQEKMSLAEEVKRNRCLWDAKDPKHFNNNSLASSWNRISLALGKPVIECKLNWASLRDSKRYHLRTAKKMKTGKDPLDSVSDDENDWEFARVLSFLPDNTKRKLETKDEPNESNDSFSSSTKVFVNAASTSTPKPVQQDSDGIIAECLQKLIAQRLEKEEPSRQSRGSENKQSGLVHPLRYQAMYANMDNMLERLPVRIVDRLNIEFLVRIQEELAAIDNE